MKHLLKILLALVTLIIIRSNVYCKENLFYVYKQADSITAQVRYQPVQFKLGLNLGIEFPYSVGVDGSLLFQEIVDVNFGFGLGINGSKIGLGTRVSPVRNKKISPMAGVYFYHSTGMRSLNVSVNEDEAQYEFKPGNAVLVDGGFRLRFGKGHYLIAGIGYSYSLNGNNVVYKSGSTSGSVQSFANKLALGGFSINAGILFKLSKGYYKEI